jgi:hypothetical protein
MSVFLNNGVQVTVDPGTGSVNLSDHVTSVSIQQTFDELEVTAMGDEAHKFIKGLEAASVTLDLLNDLTATPAVTSVLQSCYGKNVIWTFKQTSAAVSATNPLYTVTLLVNNLTPINGATGDVSSQSLTFNASSKVLVTTS